MSKIITEITIDTGTKSVNIGTKELIVGEQYTYDSKESTLSDTDRDAILAIITPYLTA